MLALNATNIQKEIIRQFCKENLSCSATVSIGHFIGNSFELVLTLLERKPEIYFGIMSTETKEILSDATISDADLKSALKALSIKYAHITSRKSPLSNEEFINAWKKFLDSGQSIEQILI